MNAGAVVFALLANQTSAGTRVYPQVLPQEPTYPAVTYQQISGPPTHLFGGVGVIRVQMQVDCWADTSYADVRQLASDVATKLSRIKGEIAGQTVLAILLDNEMEMYEAEPKVRRVSQDYTLLLR